MHTADRQETKSTSWYTWKVLTKLKKNFFPYGNRSLTEVVQFLPLKIIKIWLHKCRAVCFPYTCFQRQDGQGDLWRLIPAGDSVILSDFKIYYIPLKFDVILVLPLRTIHVRNNEQQYYDNRHRKTYIKSMNTLHLLVLRLPHFK